MFRDCDVLTSILPTDTQCRPTATSNCALNEYQQKTASVTNKNRSKAKHLSYKTNTTQYADTTFGVWSNTVSGFHFEFFDLDIIENAINVERLCQRLFTAQRSYASTVLRVVILSLCLSHTCFVTKWKNILPIFWKWKDNHSSFLIPIEAGGRCPLPLKICA